MGQGQANVTAPPTPPPTGRYDSMRAASGAAGPIVSPRCQEELTPQFYYLFVFVVPFIVVSMVLS
jgi:hypothetical protein